MKEFPSIPRSTPDGPYIDIGEAYVFDKLDGRNLRFEWAPKRGWHKFGTRHRLFDTTDPEHGPALLLFHADLAEPLERRAHAGRWQRLVVFCEFWSAQSLGGVLVPGDPMKLTLIGAAPYKQGLLGPRAFRELFEGQVETPRFLGRHNWTRDFTRRVRRSEVPGMTFEGVVGWSGEGHKLVFSKAKTQAWIDAILARYGEDEGRKIVES